MACPWQEVNISVLGCGFMGTSILEGLLKPSPDQQTVKVNATACVRSSASLDRIKATLGTSVHAVQEGFVEAAKGSNLVILGVPPDQLKPLLQLSGLRDALRGKIIISLLAGVSCEQILNELTDNNATGHGQYHLLRVIPTIAANAGDSVTLLADKQCCGKEERQVGEWLLRQIGSIQLVPEHLMDTATAVNAACNALVIVALEAAVDGSVAEGLPRESAMALAAQSIRSAAGLACRGMTPETIKAAMSIPQGITINSLCDLERARVRTGIADSVRQAIVYTKNMAS